MDTKKTKEYMDFMYDKNNLMRCRKCPENKGYHQGSHKCGKTRCLIMAYWRDEY